MKSELIEWLSIAAHIGTIIAALAVLATTRFVRQQVALQARDVDNEERRDMRESLTVVHDTLQDPGFREARQAFFSGAHQQAFDSLSEEDSRNARRILSVYELLARMLKHGAVDEAMVRDYWQASLARDWERLENFVSGERMRTRNHRQFGRVEDMVNKWQSK